MQGKIAVIGLGYVGLPVAAAFAEKFPGTVGFDIDTRRVAALRGGVGFLDQARAVFHQRCIYEGCPDVERIDHFIAKASETPSLGKAGPEGRLAVDASGKVICWIDGPNLFISREGAQKSLPHEIDVAETISISPNGAIVAVGTRNRVGVKVFEVDTGKKLWEAAIGKGTHLAFSSDSQWLAVGTDNGCHVYSANSGKVRWELIPGQHEQPCFWEVAFSPDGKYVAWTPKPSQVQILSASDGSEVLTLDYPCRRYITGLGFSPDGRWLAETSNEHNLHLWNLKELHHQLDSYGLGW